MNTVNNAAEKYAEGKMNEAIKKAIAQAYKDGFRDGYKAREIETPVNLNTCKTEYVDLGLPSGTLWAKDYERENGEILYDYYWPSRIYKLPTKGQIEELNQHCKVQYNADLQKIVVTGPNGNCLEFTTTGYLRANDIHAMENIYLWLDNGNGDINHNALANIDEADNYSASKQFATSGGSHYFKYPIRQVR